MRHLIQKRGIIAFLVLAVVTVSWPVFRTPRIIYLPPGVLALTQDGWHQSHAGRIKMGSSHTVDKDNHDH